MERFTIEFDVDSGMPPEIPNFTRIHEHLQRDRPDLRSKYSGKASLLREFRGSAGVKIVWAKEAVVRIERLCNEIQGRIKVVAGLQPSERRIILAEDFPSLLGELQKEIDFFVFELRGSIDVLSILIGFTYQLCKGSKKTLRMDLNEARKALNKHHGNERITQLFNNLYEQAWFRYLNSLRNRITHRLPLSPGITLSDFYTCLYLPDDPDALSSSCTKKLDIVENCRLWLEESCNFIEEVSDILGEKLFTSWRGT